MTVVTRDAVAPALFGAPQPEPQHSTDPPAIAAVDLVREFPRKRKDPVRALRGLSLTVAQGQVHGLLGPNGAGKATLVKILSTILLPTTGYATVCMKRRPHLTRGLIGDARVSCVRDGAVVVTRSPHAVAGLVSTAQGLELDGVDPALAGVPDATSITAIRGPASANMAGTRCAAPAARRTCAGLC
ncbi:ATP-binding cassette domain-containing protein [Streptomyces inhibens]|uniref:ATP-binding cassette domain-containing protein n=1 Tax=Streptomyces inhibens TaxID=2293571 RepID=UPI0037AF84C2